MEYIYIFRSYIKDSTLLKFGYSTDIWARLAGYKSANPCIEIVYIAQLKNAFEFEQEFHKKHPATFGNEWYDENLLPTMMAYLNSINHINYTKENKPKRVYNPKYEVIGENFKSILKEYCDLIDERIVPEHYTKEDRLKHLELLEPTIKTIVEKLGTNKCRTLNYAKKGINEAIYTKSNAVTNSIKSTVESQFEKNKIYTSKEVKIMLQQTYDKLKMNKKARATDIADFFIVDKKSRNINGKSTDSVVIINNII